MTSSFVTKERERFIFPWLFGRQVDLLFFFAPVALGIALFAISEHTAVSASLVWTLIVLNGFGAGPFHWGPTWFAYLDKKNREHWLGSDKKRFVFFIAPPLIMVLSIVGNIYVSWLVQAITMVWVVQHLCQQNIGILLLYHNKNNAEAIVNRPLEAKSQQIPAIFFSACFLNRLLMGSPGGLIWSVIGWALALCAASVVAAYAIDLTKQLRQGARLNVPSTAFWMISVLYFLPFAVVGRDFYQAFIIPVTVHWFQYIGLNYILVKHKYTANGTNVAGADFPKMMPLTLLLLSCIFWGLLWFGLAVTGVALGASGITAKFLVGIFLGLANCHYFLDSYLWRFRELYQRETVLPYLLVPRQQSLPAVD